MRLENYIMEQDINTASVADIFVEQAEAELNVAMSLLDATVKDLTFQEFAVYQEGELGTAVADARAEVREDGKKHHIKAAIAAIKAFFKFLITKVGSFFKKNKTEGAAACSKMAVAMKQASSVAGTEMDILLPYTKETFGRMYSFYDSFGAKLEKVTDISNKIVDWIIQEQNTFTDSTKVKYEKEIDAIVEQVKNIRSYMNPDTDFKKKAKAEYKAQHKEISDSDWRLDTDGNYVFVEKNSNSIYISYEEYRRFIECIDNGSKYWEKEKKSLEENLKTLTSMQSNATELPGSRPTRPKYDKDKSKADNKKAVERYKSDVAAYDKGNREFNKNRIIAAASQLLKKLSGAIAGMIAGAETIISQINKNKFKAVDRSKFSSNIGDGKRFANAHEAAEWKKAHPNESLKNVDDDIAGMPKPKSKYEDSSRSIYNDDESKDSTNIGGITFSRALS